MQFYSDASVSGDGFKFRYTASDKPAVQPCPSGQRAVTFFVDTGASDVNDVAWMVLHQPRSGMGSEVVAAGGLIPDVEELSAWAASNGTEAFPKLPAGLPKEELHAYLVKAESDAEKNSAHYHPWTVATEVRCLVAGANHQLLPMASDASSWSNSRIIVAVPTADGMSSNVLHLWSSNYVAAADSGDGTFEVPVLEGHSAVDTVVNWKSLPGLGRGKAGFHTALTIEGDLAPEDLQGVGRGMLCLALAQVLETSTNDIIPTAVAVDSSEGVAVDDTPTGGDRRLLGRKAGSLQAAKAEVPALSKEPSDRQAALQQQLQAAMQAAGGKVPSRHHMKRRLAVKQAAGSQGLALSNAHLKLAASAGTGAGSSLRRRLLQQAARAIDAGGGRNAVVSFKVIGELLAVTSWQCKHNLQSCFCFKLLQRKDLGLPSAHVNHGTYWQAAPWQASLPLKALSQASLRLQCQSATPSC